MADYAIGDVQGCYEPLLRLLDHIQFNDQRDRLWFVGDLVNRGPQSLDVLRFIKALPLKPRVTLGNHDLHLLVALFHGAVHKNRDDTLDAILLADDALELGHWLRQQHILYHDDALNVVMCHAGIAPMWDLRQAKQYAAELETALREETYPDYFAAMYGNEPRRWSSTLTGFARLRSITNYFTRMRFCDEHGALQFDYKGGVYSAPPHHIPWYAVPARKAIAADIVFGHWAALKGVVSLPRIHALDTGCLWGGRLSALRLQDKKRFFVAGLC